MEQSPYYDEDLGFLQHCSEEQLASSPVLLLTPCLNNERQASASGVLLITGCSKRWKVTRQHRRNWQLDTSEFQRITSGDGNRQQIARTRKTIFRAVLLDVAKAA